jgi:FkbM family methyltransferase
MSTKKKIDKRPKRGCGNLFWLFAMVVFGGVGYWQQNSLRTILLKDEGPSNLTWKENVNFWDKKGILHDDKQYACRWIETNPKGTSQKSIDVCLHPEDTDDRSALFSKFRSHDNLFRDCVINTKYWKPNHPKQYYMEVGTHVGICVLAMLVNTKANVIAVESHPKNLFALTSTLLKNPQFLDRVTLIPVALGSEATNHADMILTEDNNYYSAAMAPQQLGTIPMTRLDDILHPGGVQLLSLHVNGYECRVLEGGMKFMNKLSKFSFSLHRESLEHYSCNSERLLSMVQNAVAEPKWFRGSGGRLRPLPNKLIDYFALAQKNV